MIKIDTPQEIGALIGMMSESMVGKVAENEPSVRCVQVEITGIMKLCFIIVTASMKSNGKLRFVYTMRVDSRQFSRSTEVGFLVGVAQTMIRERSE